MKPDSPVGTVGRDWEAFMRIGENRLPPTHR